MTSYHPQNPDSSMGPMKDRQNLFRDSCTSKEIEEEPQYIHKLIQIRSKTIYVFNVVYFQNESFK